MTQREALRFYNTYKQRLFNSAMRVLNNSMDAEEVVQDTVLKYLFNNNLSLINLSKEQEAAWLHKTCIRASIDMIRKRNTYKSFKEDYLKNEDSLESSDSFDLLISSLDDTFSDSILFSKIKESMTKLPDGYRTIFSLILFEGYDYEEIASMLEVSESTVRSQFLRSKRKLLEIMQQK